MSINLKVYLLGFEASDKQAFINAPSLSLATTKAKKLFDLNIEKERIDPKGSEKEGKTMLCKDNGVCYLQEMSEKDLELWFP